MNKVSVFGRNAAYFGASRPRYAYRITFGGNVRVTTDPVEVAQDDAIGQQRLTRTYHNAPAASIKPHDIKR